MSAADHGWPSAVFADLDRICLSPGATLRDAMACIEASDRGIALIVDSERRLLDTITDGDIRRAMLGNVSLDEPVNTLRDRRRFSAYPAPVTARVTAAPVDALRTLEDRRLLHLPLLDEDDRLCGVVTLRDLRPAEALALAAVVMAGGQGTRLRPLTADTPKPMLPMDGRPLMERIITQLGSAGIRRVSVTTHYRPEKIVEHFGDGSAFGIDLSYINEQRPLGTAGALALLDPPPAETLLVMNGDIVTEVDFRAMLAFHREHRADLTVAVRAYQLDVPYGVMDCEGARVTGLREKPQLNLFVNAGIYLLEPSVLSHIPRQVHVDMTDLIQTLVERGKPVVGFPIHEYWLDVGGPEAYRQAQQDLADRRAKARQPSGANIDVVNS